ncbi:5'/3'-nucleotidase SurE [Hyalangium gracile]|uniref:5'/3'-nucleotidase SurE n=1 Tax=Hyalangium gracile TaxID=394092 RepID=UPI001CCD1C00|nr:5'/3'-nucleotidase SurE [Hyalangium gracile]
MRTHLTLSSLLTLALLSLGSTAQAQTSEPPLRILLTNDDGVNGSGMRTLRDALCAAGHQVFVFAPSGDRSGSSGALNLNVTIRATRTEFTCGTAVSEMWAIGGTPSDSVLFGLSMLGEQNRPDLVISGMNLGQNVGRAVNHSGTVGAAVTAAEEGVPSFAVSVAINPQDAATGFSQTVAAAPYAAAYVNQLISKLRQTAQPGEPLLPDRVMLNVNYPVILGTDGLFAPTLVQGARVTAVGHGEVVHPTYTKVANSADLYVASGPICGLQVACAPETQWNADTTALEAGAISVSPVVVDGSLRLWLLARIHARLR